ncbi:hypothetical protein Tco_0868986 [Tanacetum coccineum]
MGEEFEAFEPISTRTDSSHSSDSSDSTTPMSPDHPLTYVSPTPTPTQVSFHRRTARMVVRTQPTLSPGMSARIAETTALSPSSFRKRYRSSYETSSSSSLTLPGRKRYRGLKDAGFGLEEEEADQAVLVVETALSKFIPPPPHPLRLGYGALRRHELAVEEDQVPSTFEVGQSSRSVPEQEGVERISAFRQPTLVTWVDPEDDRVYTDVLAYAPPAAPIQTPLHLLSGRLVPYQFRSLESEQERTAITFGALWRLVLALKAWTRRVDTRLADMSRDRPIRRIYQGRYGVSVPALSKDHKRKKPNTPYLEDQYTLLEIWNEYNILEDIKRDPYSKKLQYAVSNPLDTPSLDEVPPKSKNDMPLRDKGAIPSKTAVDAKVAIQEMVEYSQKWHNGASRSRSIETSEGLAAIQAQLNNLGREIKKVNEKVYAAQVGCEQCKGPYYTKD